MARRAPRRAGNDLRNLAPDVRKAAFDALRNAAKEVLNDLAEISPNWGGAFRESWYVETSDGKRGVKPTGEGGKYNLFNIPQLGTQSRTARGQFGPVVPPANKVQLFIGNLAPYAQEAMDLIPGRFKYPGFEPAGEEQPRGTRQNGIRGDLRAPGKNRSTAPLDWYSTYMGGGAFTAAFNKGAKAGFLEARKPFRPK
jgi:hypothetical protein